MYDEANHSRSFRVMSPSGEIMGLSMGKDGPQKVAWGSFTEIMKGVQVLRDGSLESVSLSLGDAHKVRNFYNNIVAPDSQLGRSLSILMRLQLLCSSLFQQRDMRYRMPSVLHP